ncbi:hypothetical protein HHK36_024051 [Tetracentron sinense]|uniref:Uncharacterized protein n=1 Tax=Tetracentron sinense TaxID=13715 RepID=A0A835D4A3_TETSI|nr:hypothetical protein HHK36_024051 [Tetracentron sinense]
MIQVLSPSLSKFISFSLINCHKAASLADSSPASVPLPLRVEPKPKSGIRYIFLSSVYQVHTFEDLQQDLLKNVVEIKPKRQRASSPSDGNQPTLISSVCTSIKGKTKSNPEIGLPLSMPDKAETDIKWKNPVKSLLGLAYESSDDEEN